MRCTRRAVLAIVGAAPVALLGACQSAPAATPAQTGAGPGPAKLFLAVDMVIGSKNVPSDKKSLLSCTLSSRFPRNSEMVWRARVLDPATGDPVDDKAMDKVEIKLANGQALSAVFGPHPKDPPGESFWTASWIVPKDHPTGTLSYLVTATDKAGRTGEWKPFSTAPSLPIVLDEVWPDAVTKS